jgi:hypothetical protein
MSNRPKRQQKRAKQVRRTNQRAARRGQRPPTPEELTRRMLLQASELLAKDDSQLTAEMIASDLAATAWNRLFGAPTDEQQQMSAPELSVVRMLATQVHATDQRVRDTALALTLVVVAFDPSDAELTTEGPALVKALGAAGARVPRWADDVGGYEVTEAWQARDPWGTQFDLLIGFRDPSGNEHTLVTMGDEASGYQLTEAHIDEPIGELAARLQQVIDEEADERQRTLQVFEQLSPARAGYLLQALVEGTFDADAQELNESESSLSGCSQIFARFDLLHRTLSDTDEWGSSSFASELDERSADELHDAFVASEQRAAESGATDDAARAVTTWVSSDKGPVHNAVFAPLHVMQFIDEGVPAGADAGAIAAALRAWARYAASHAPISDAATDIVVQFIDSQGEELAGAVRAAGAKA